MPPRLPPPPQVTKSGAPTPPKIGESESSKPTAEPDAWLLGEIDAFAGSAEASGAKAASEASGVKAVSESSGAKASSESKPPSEASAPKPPTKPAHSATAALVGIGDDLISNASAEDKPVFTAIVAKAEAKSVSREPAVFDELGLAKTPAVITGHTVREIDTSGSDDDGKIVVGAAAAASTEPLPPKKTAEGFPVPPPRPAAPKAAAASAIASPSTSTSRGTKPMSRWTPHVLLGTLGLASIIAIAFRCSGTSTSTASADTGKKAPVVAKAGDDVRGASAASGGDANSGAKGGGANGAADAADERAGGGNAAAADVQVDGDDKAGGGAAEAQADGGDAAVDGAPTEDAAKDDAAAADAAKGDAAADDAAKGDAQAAAAPTNGGGAAKDTTPASTSSKSKSRTSPTPIGPSTPSPETSMTADELLELARKAWAAGNSRDTYKYANKSRYKKASTEATELATLSACKLKLEKSAKASFDDLSGDKRRKVRQKCRDWGVWVGL